MNKDELIQEEKRLMDLYYETKRKVNRTSDQSQILNIWDEAKSYWNKAIKIREKINKFYIPDGD